MAKKETKKKCKEKISAKLILCGEIFATIGFIMIVVAMLFIKTFETSIIGFVLLGGVIAIIGIILDFIGEVILSKEYK